MPYNLFDDVKKVVEGSTSHVYQNKFSVTSTQPIITNGSKFKLEAYSAKTLAELINEMSRIIEGVESPVTIGKDIAGDLANSISEGYYGVYSVLLQTYAFLCRDSTIISINLARAKVVLEQQMILFVLTHPLNVRGAGEALQSLQTFRVGFYDQLRILYQEINNTAIREANKMVPKAGTKPAPSNVQSEESSSQSPTQGTAQEGTAEASEAKSIMLTVVQSAVDIDGDAFVVIQNLSNTLQKGISDEFTELSKLPSEFPTQAPDLIQKANAAKNNVLKTLAREQAIGMLKDPRFFIQYELECITYQGESTTGALKYSMNLAPGEIRSIMIKTSETNSEERKKQSSVVDSTSDTAEKSFEKELTNEAKTTNKSHSDTEQYLDRSKSASFGAYADAYLDITAKIVEAGCSGGLTYDTDESTDWGGSTSIGSSLEAAKENTFRAMEKQNHTACNNRTVSITESNQSITTTIAENMQKIEISNPNKLSPTNINLYEVKTMYHILMSVIGVNLYFGNGIQWRKIDMARLDSELKTLLSDGAEINRIKNYFKAALVILDYKNRAVSIVDPDSKFYRVNTTPYGDILRTNKIPLSDTDKEWDNREVSGVLIGMRNFVTTQSGTLMVGSVGKPLADRVLCRTIEQGLENEDFNLKGKEYDVGSKSINNSVKEKMANHCERLSNKDDTTATDSYFKLFGVSAADLMGKVHVIDKIDSAPMHKVISQNEFDSDSRRAKKKRKSLFKSE